MKFSQTCIQRPVFTSVIAFILILAGLIAYLELPVRFSPFYFKPVLTIDVTVAGASAQYVEENIATPLEQSLGGTPGLDIMTSHSSQGEAMIFLNFKSLSPQQFITAQSQVMQEVDGTKLPETADRPQILQNDGDNMVMLLGVADNQMSQVDLSNYVYNYLMPELEQVPGVAQIMPFANKPVLRLTLDPQKMASFNISVNDIQNALNSSNTSYPLGSLLTDQQSIQLNAQISVPDIAGFQNLIIAKKGGRLVYLKDIADVTVSDRSLDPYYAYMNGQPGIAVAVDQTNQANPIQVGQTLTAVLTELKPNFPAGLTVTPVFDVSQPLHAAINEVYLTILIAIILVVLVTFSFLGTWRATFIPIVTIPICLTATFAVMLALGFSINIMTLLALVMAVGLVVDDAIVVLENTYRHLEAGCTPQIAAQKSIDEISFAVLGITVCLIAVYLPAVFLPPNIDSTYFQEFAFSLAGAILISGGLALTLSPMMCSRFLRAHNTSNRYEKKIEQGMQALHQRYAKILDWTLKHPKTILSILAINLLAGIVFFILLPTDLLPPSPLGYIQGSLTGPDSASAEYMNQATTSIRSQLAQNPALKNILMYINDNGGNVFFMAQLKNVNQRNQVVQALNQQLNNIPAFSGSVMPVDANNDVSSSHSGSLFFYITGLSPYETIAHAANTLQQALQSDPKILMADNQLQFSEQEYNFSINRSLANMLGVDLGTLNNTLSTFLGGYTFPNTSYQVNGYGYDIVMQLSRDNLRNLNILQDIYVANSSNQLIPASRLISISADVSLPDRVHVNQLRAGEVDVIPAPGYSNGAIMQIIQTKAAQILPQGLQISWGGQGRNLLQNSASGNIFIILGLIFIYFVLAALFESFLDPLIILCTVPLCIVAGLIALYAIDGSINIYTKIALVTLIGLVSKHGVLITQFANQLQSEGVSTHNAVIQAALIRLRPILMTTLTMVLGALPLLFAFGTDAIGRQQIGAIVVFGLLFGSFFSLLVVPVAYMTLARFKKKFKHRTGRIH